MKKLFKIVGGIILGLFVLGLLLPDPKKDGKAGAGMANASAISPSAGEGAGEPVTEAPAAEEKPDLEILKTSETANEFARTIHVKVRNNTDHLIQYADLKGVYYDKGKNIVGTGMGNAANIAAGATKTIDIMSMGIENADSYEVEMGNVLD
ncbi:FxLYD domain-containing protein [Hymenobacter glacieicola]|uniref:DUF4352 domain-containing protein n=1 Tax=Hymenobacter glacieicola TaxID=1562124 RepID=A0ABQ1WJQ8_9BACT|nr:FxLYD domain-containing protein [Hymenobacter glacieicola]GGG33287.1 hypothetical protein GCM10011378_07160 [Hymenobacter glacieicola]